MAFPAATPPKVTQVDPDEGPLDIMLPLRSAGSLENPYPIYDLLRTVRPTLPIPMPENAGSSAWLLTRYDDVHLVLSDRRFSADRMNSPLIRNNLDRLPDFLRQSAEGLRNLLTLDPPDHTRIRKLVNKAFTPKRIEALRGHIESITENLLDDLKSNRSFDLIHEVAEPLPAVVIAELLGVPARDHRQFRNWSSALIQALGSPDAKHRKAATEAGQHLFAYLSKIIEERRKEPRDDLISAMLEAQEEKDALTDLELLATSNLLLIAGHETTTHLIGNGVLNLLREPSAWERLCREPQMMNSAVEELLRFDGPVQATLRVAREDVEISEKVIPKGALVVASIGAANRDPAIFEDPGRLCLDRHPNPHLGFGFSTHFCLGAPLARLETEVVLRALTQRFPHLSLADENPKYRENPILRGLTKLELNP